MTRLAALMAALIAAVLLLVSGCAQTTETPAPKPDPVPTDSTELRIGFGALGPVKIGMSVAQAKATKMFAAEAPAPVEGCPAPTLIWKKQFKNVDVIASEDQGVVSMGVRGPGPKTKKGIGVGSTLAALKKTYGAEVMGPTNAGFQQSGAWVKRGDSWIGFLFNPPTSALTDASKISFIEVGKGEKPPELIRDGC